MENSTNKKCDTGSNLSEAGKVGIKNRLKIIATSALLLAATNAMAGLVFLPGSIVYTNTELAPVSVQHLDDGSMRVHTTGLTGELSLNVSTSGNDESPPEFHIATTEKVVLPFDQEMELVIDIAEGTVSGRSTANLHLDMASSKLVVTAAVSGSASCLPLNGRECGQLVVDLELRGVLSDPNDPSIVGKLQMDVLASLVFDGSDVGYWAAMSANTTIGGNEVLMWKLTDIIIIS